MRITRYLLFVFLICLTLPVCARAQYASAPSATEPHDAAHVTLITLGPGEEIYEKFSHNALWIHNPREVPPYRDVAFNYGLFSFGGDFLYRFAIGEMRYWMAGQGALEMIDGYRLDNRQIWTQKLNLTQTQVEDLNRFLWNNSREENRYYTYNYYADNCSTRIRDGIDRTVGGAIKSQLAGQLTGRTYRFHTRRAMSSNVVLYVCVDFLMGRPTDREITKWDEMFLPEYVMRYLPEVQINGSSLVAEQATLHVSTRSPVPETPPNWLPRFAAFGILLAAALLLLDRYSTRSRLARLAKILLMVAWLALASIAGCVLALMNAFTDHWAAFPNENLLQMAPVALIALLLLPWTAKGKRKLPAVLVRTCVIALPVFSGLGLLLKLTPWFNQDNWQIIVWVLPVHIALAIIVVRALRPFPQSAA